MTSTSSGNLLADRRYGIADGLAAEGDHLAAADLLEQTVELVPGWAPAWLALGLAREQIGQAEPAAAAIRQAMACDPEGRFGAALHLARMTGAAPAAMPGSFVRDLFDGYADRFEEHLTGALGYTGPTLIAAALRRVTTGRFRAVLDLGCGTGLMARALADRADTIDGIDLSPRMVRLAQATGLYRTVAVGEIVADLAARPAACHDLLLAADVLVYIGDLMPLLTQARRVLAPAGTIAFTVQRGDRDDYALGPDMRFRHGTDYVAKVLAASGFSPVLSEPVSTRMDRGLPVPGLLVVAQRP